MTEVMSSNGYGSFADPKNSNREISKCVEQEANAKEFNLFTKASLLSDPIAVDLDTIQSQGPGYYTMENMNGCGCELKDARAVQLSQPVINFEGGKGWIGEKGCLVDNDSELRFHDATQLRYINQLPSLNNAGFFGRGDHNVNDESINKQFLKKHFDEKSGPLFKCDNIDRFCDTANAPSAMPPNLYYMGDDTTLYYDSYDMKSEQGWGELVNLIKVTQ